MAYGTFWSVVGGLAARGFTLLSSMVVARSIGRDEFGSLGIVYSTIGLIQLLAGFGLGLTATRGVAASRCNNQRHTGRVISVTYLLSALVATVIAACAWFLTPLTASRLMHQPELIFPLRLSVLMIIPGAIRGVQDGALIGFEAFRTHAILNTSTAVVTGLATMAGGYALGLNGVIGGMFLGCMLGTGIGHAALGGEMSRQNVQWQWTGLHKQQAMIANYSIPDLLRNLIVLAATWGANIILVRQANGLREMAILSAANQWYIVTLFLPAQVGQSALPVLTERLGKPDGDCAVVLRALLWMNLIVGLPTAILLSALCPWLLSGYGKGFSSGWAAFSLLQGAALLQGLQSPLVKLWEAKGHMWTNLLLNTVWGMAVLSLSWRMAALGALGMAAARVIAFAVFGVGLLLAERHMRSWRQAHA